MADDKEDDGKRIWITAQVEPEMREEIKRIAKQENRSASAQIRQFIMEGIERRSKQGAGQ
jgi:hypothetical protein